MSRGRVSAQPSVELRGFELLSTPAGACAGPGQVDWAAAARSEQALPIGALLAARGALDPEHPPPLDALDHWYRTILPSQPGAGDQVLVFEGLATLVDVFLDGVHALRTDNMFVAEELILGAGETAGRELTLCFRALATELAKRRPRPRWRTRLVEQQQLRFVRTSLLGRTPGFCPNVPVIGPYRPIRLSARAQFHLRRLRLWTESAGPRGDLRVELALAAAAGAPMPERAVLIVEGAAGHGRTPVALHAEGEHVVLRGRAPIDDLARWWPHTHGAQPLSTARIELDGGTVIELGRVGFRELAVDRGDDGHGFRLLVNGVPLFARGACWTTDDLWTLGSRDLRATLELVRAAGMNMLRIGGTTAYESERFHELCDELGILVFQDFMFANMDYPEADPAFRASVEREAHAVLDRIAHRPSLAVLCGGSEVQQQAAMLGLPPAQWESPLFDALLPRWCHERAPSVPYVPSSPSGGDLPFHCDRGIAHYYGVGAYLRELEDVRRADVRFAAECLAFANLPCSETIEHFMRDLESPAHHPRWKQRVPRDRGASWDFEDVRDHYVERLFQVDARALRYGDMERYLALGRAAVAEVMESTFAEWRRAGSRCGGGLVFWLKDLWEGAGWGLLDARGRPKSAYYALRRILAPRTVAVTDEGLNGLTLHIVNDGPEALEAQVELELYRLGETAVARAETPVRVPPHDVLALRADALLGRFMDLPYAYRFGPPSHHASVVRLRIGEDVLARAFHFPLGRALPMEGDLGLRANAQSRDGVPGVEVTTRRLAQCVTLDVPGFVADDDYFHLEPGAKRWIALKALDADRLVVRGSVGALNLHGHVQIAVQGTGGD